MGEEREDRRGEDQQQHSLTQTQHQALLKRAFWPQILRTSSCLAPVAAVWLVCQLEALPLQGGFCKLLSVCLLWAAVAAGVYTLKGSMRPGQTRLRRNAWRRSSSDLLVVCSRLSRMPPTLTPEAEVPLSQALTDSLLLCVLQEPLHDATVSHVQALHSRLQAVANRLGRAKFEPEEEEEDRRPALTEKLKLFCFYLQQRTASLQSLVQVQTDFESSVKELRRGLDSLWVQLEELHAGVTLTRQDGQGSRDLSLVEADAESLSSVLGRHQNKLQSCQAHLKDSTQLLQELTWSQTHFNSKVNTSCESIWPELMLQSNIEQFDEVQENLTSLEQQTSTFRMHLQGLGIDHQEGPVGSLGSVQNTLFVVDLPLRTSTPVMGTKKTPSAWLREKSSGMGCLPKPGRKK